MQRQLLTLKTGPKKKKKKENLIQHRWNFVFKYLLCYNRWKVRGFYLKSWPFYKDFLWTGFAADRFHGTDSRASLSGPSLCCFGDIYPDFDQWLSSPTRLTLRLWLFLLVSIKPTECRDGFLSRPWSVTKNHRSKSQPLIFFRYIIKYGFRQRGPVWAGSR